MANKKFNASKSRSNRPGWSIIFRHPVRTDSRGERGLKVRRGLGTSDEAQADRLVAQMNELLGDESWWNGDRRRDAESRYDRVVVSAFFDGIEALRFDSVSKREELIPLPTASDGYSTILFLGTTGAGKTTLLRHVIGSESENDRFPSTSTAKTTTADFEIVTAPGNYTAAITFMPEHEVRAHIDECIEEACLQAVQKKSSDKIAAALLEHREQRFRLSYVLGGWDDTVADEDDDFSFDDKPDISPELNESETVSPEEQEQNRASLKAFVKRIETLALAVEQKIAESLGKIDDQKNSEDKATWLELFGSEVFKQDEFADVALDIMEEVAGRFSTIKEGELKKSPTNWPTLWAFECDERDLFLSTVRWFSSNNYQQFGRLLTPLADGIRVKGPLFPELSEVEDELRLILLDGQGLGHTATSVSSVSTRITKKFAGADMILLVDNAQQPMQAAPLALLRSVGSSGFARKLAIAFTHFDQVNGANLGSFKQKRDHVLGSVNNAIAGLRDIVGSGVAGAIERHVDDHSFFLGGLHGRTAKLPKGIMRELDRLIKTMQSAVEPVEKAECSPEYEFKGLEIAMHDAIDGFRDPWRAKLGLSYHDGISKEHWARIKALSRRFANSWADEYDTLTPVADLLARLQEEASKWLDRPAGWTRQPENEGEREIALDAIREAVFSELYQLTKSRLTDEQIDHWRDAYDFRGTGSADKRSRLIEEIHDHAAPRISAAMSPDARAFLDQLHKILKEAILKSGGKIVDLES